MRRPFYLASSLSIVLVAAAASLGVVVTADPVAAGSGGTTHAYVVDVTTETLYRHDLDDPGILNPVAPLSSPGGTIIGGCDTLSESSRLLYCIDASVPATLLTIDLDDGATTTLGSPDPGLLGVFTALATEPTSGTLYATAVDLVAGFSNLYTLDIQNGTPTLVGRITNAAGVTAAAFDPAGQLYVYADESDFLVAVDASTAVGTVIGSTGFDSFFNVSLDFSADGTCYFWGRNALDINELRICDPSTGATIPVGDVGVTSPGGFLGLSGGALVLAPPVIFADGFESSDTSAWSASVN